MVSSILCHNLPQKFNIYMHNLSKRHNRRRLTNSLFSCRCLAYIAIVWVLLLWFILAYNDKHDNKTIDHGFDSFKRVTPLPLDLNKIGQNIVNLPRKFFDNVQDAFGKWAGYPGDAGLGVLPPPKQEDKVNPKGYGENGEAVVFKNLNPEQQKLMDEGWQRNAFNQYVSDQISLHRSLPEVRDAECLAKKYDDDLPTTSIVMCFHNEAWSVLLRGVHSIIDRTPSHLLEEIILVDDFSDQDHLKTRLEDYLAKLGKARVVRTNRREGLIRARLLGAKHAKGDVITFLDSHIECAQGWAEPLLQRIKEDRRHVVCPVIDVIDDTTFQYHYSGASGTNLGGFDWSMQFNWHSIPEREKKRRKSNIDPLYSPTMAGGLFSISRKYFEEIGTYDAAMDIWGGENLELSFRVWMCGGTLEILPCSHIGHIFRKRSPYSWKNGENVLKKNSVRVALVWLDEYADYYFQRINHELGNYGDISARVKLRKDLKCKNFSWYIHNVFPELFVPGDALSNGEIRNLGNESRFCLDSAANRQTLNKPMQMWECHKQGGNQYWMLSREGEIRRDDMCLDYSGSDPVIYGCHGQGGNQFWVYYPQEQIIKHHHSDKCLEMDFNTKDLHVSECNGSNKNQKWRIENYKYGNTPSNMVPKATPDDIDGNVI